MNYLFEEKAILHLDQSLCVMESLGQAIRIITTQEHEVPDHSCLADLGTLVSQQAMATLELLHNEKTVAPVALSVQGSRAV